MSISVDDILENVLVREGWPKYTEHPFDRGGPTKGGITQRTLESWRQRRCTRKELQRLKKPEALEILRRLYVDASGIQRLEGHPIQAQVVDNAVLSGPILAMKDLQGVLGVATDGICGPITLKALNGYEINTISNLLAVARAKRLARFTVKNPNQLVFLVGWLSRALGFVHGHEKSTDLPDLRSTEL